MDRKPVLRDAFEQSGPEPLDGASRGNDAFRGQQEALAANQPAPDLGVDVRYLLAAAAHEHIVQGAEKPPENRQVAQGVHGDEASLRKQVLNQEILPGDVIEDEKHLAPGQGTAGGGALPDAFPELTDPGEGDGAAPGFELGGEQPREGVDREQGAITGHGGRKKAGQPERDTHDGPRDPERRRGREPGRVWCVRPTGHAGASSSSRSANSMVQCTLCRISSDGKGLRARSARVQRFRMVMMAS